MSDQFNRPSGTTRATRGTTPMSHDLTNDPGLGRVGERVDPIGEHTHDRLPDHRCPVQTAAAIVATLFVLAGIAGFVPGITDNAGDIDVAGHESPAELFGIFQVSVLHNLVHLLFGVVGLAAARTMRSARVYLVAGGLAYLALALVGAFIEQGDDLNVLPMNDADDWLHLGLGTAMVALGLALWHHRTHHAPAHRTAAGRS